MNIYTEANFSKFELVHMEAQFIRDEQAKAAPIAAESYHAYMGNGVELLLQAIEYGIEGDALDARIEQWRADSPAAVEELQLAHTEQLLKNLGRAYSKRPRQYKGSGQPKPNWNEVRWGFVKADIKKLSNMGPVCRALVGQMFYHMMVVKKPDDFFISWQQASDEYNAAYEGLLEAWPSFPKKLPNIDWLLRHRVNTKRGLARRFAGATSPVNLGQWEKPEALRISRAQSWVLVKNGEMGGKAEYLAKLSQYDAHPDFGPWIDRWLAEHSPINKNGLGYGVEFKLKGQTGYVSHTNMPWKIPVTQVIEHWESEAEVIEFPVCKNKKFFATYCQNFWRKVSVKQRKGKKLLVLAPKAVIDFRLKSNR